MFWGAHHFWWASQTNFGSSYFVRALKIVIVWPWKLISYRISPFKSGFNHCSFCSSVPYLTKTSILPVSGALQLNTYGLSWILLEFHNFHHQSLKFCKEVNLLCKIKRSTDLNMFWSNQFYFSLRKSKCSRNFNHLIIFINS